MMTYLVSWEQEKEIRIFLSLQKRKESKSRYLYVRCIKSDDPEVSAMDNDIKERWREYVNKLLNEGFYRRHESKKGYFVSGTSLLPQN